MEIDYGAVFGISETGEETTEPAAPSAEAGAQGENEQEAAAPAADGTEIAETESLETGKDENADEGPAGAGAGEKRQTPEENAKYAAARRKAEAERDAAIAKARQEAQEEARRVIDEAFRGSGMINPYTKQPITSRAEYEEYRQRYDAEKKARLLQKSGMTDEEFRQFIENLPEVRQAREAQAQAENAAKEAREQQAKMRVEEQMREISALDPSIKDLSDLAGMETYPKFYELVKRGNTLTDAFKLANYEALTKGAVSASRQAALNAAQGKRHLTQTSPRGSGAANVPADIRKEYLAFNPDATDAEIQAHYNKYRKMGKD